MPVPVSKRGLPPACRPARACIYGLFLLALCGGRGVQAGQPTVTVRSSRILLPAVTSEICDAGRVEADRSRGNCAVQLEVHTQGAAGGWILTIRAEQSALQPGADGRSFPEVKWKLDQEDEGQYRPLDDHEMVVLENPAGGDALVGLDLSTQVGWELEPGNYSLGIVFQVVSL
jgi:hypothetical protein